MDAGGGNRGSFTGKIGFVLAAAGSAVGLGNIWRFPYLAAKYGGGIFLLVYILLSVTFGFTLMVAEIAIGRKTGQSPIGAFRALDKRFTFIGVLGAVVPMLILPYYSVIGGWVTKYAFGFMTGHMTEMATNIGESTYFGMYISNVWEPIGWFALFMGATALIVLFGVQKGVEKVSKVMMPVLVVLMIFIVIYSFCTTDNVWEGVVYYLKPDFSKFTYMTVVAAMGQLFYSMSLAMGIMITFGSYMKKDISIENSAHQIEIFDTGIAFLAGLMIVPACVAYDPSQLTKGPGLMFGVLPKVFDNMFGGAFIGTVFFLMVLLAALTSSISLMETVVSTVQDKWKLSRRVSCLIVFGISILLGVLSCLGYSAWDDILVFGKFAILDFFDFVTNSVMMPIIALCTCIFVSFILKPSVVIDEISLSGRFRLKGMFSVIIRYIAPVCLLVILVFAILEGVGVITV
ncbi:MAG: sodium-dependent transporter [Ruminococcaceae bacterium]|nr:sodium-dependent transporter [Oscillospiraceae bacterium]